MRRIRFGKHVYSWSYPVVACLRRSEPCKEVCVSSLTSPDNALSTYHLSLQAPFMHPEYYPLEQQLPADRYQPVAAWYGRLILPRGTERRTVRGVLFELYLTPADQQELRGQVVRLRWSLDPSVQARVYSTARTVNLVPRAVQGAAEWRTFPIRVNHWRLVNGLESLAGSHQIDDMQAYLIGNVQLADDPDGTPCLYINRDPVLASGRYYALVTFLAPANEAGDLWRVAHFNRETRQFDGAQEIVSLPPIQPMIHGVMLSCTDKLNESPVNAQGGTSMAHRITRARSSCGPLLPAPCCGFSRSRCCLGQRRPTASSARSYGAIQPSTRGRSNRCC